MTADAITQPQERVSDPDPHCPTCRMGWWLNKPVKQHNSETHICVNCKAIYTTQMLAAPNMLAALESLQPILKEIHARWDTDMKAGKLLIALMDPKLNYRADVTAIHAAIAKARGLSTDAAVQEKV